jgi:Ca-activated chloride channel family protein
MKMLVRSLVLAAGSAALIFSAVNLSPISSAQTTNAVPTPTPPTAPIGTPTPSPDDEVIKVDTELVNLNVKVVDRNNRPINNVPESDFSIYEDGVLQQIEFFSRAEVPTNYSLVIDNSGSIRGQIEKVIDAGKILAATNKPDDETSVIRFISSDKIEILQDFTSNLEDINYALDNMYIEGGQTAIIDAVYLAATTINDYEKDKSAADRRRRALIVVSDGEDRDSYYTEAQLFELLRETDVQIYTIGFVGDLSKERGFISKSPQGKAKAFLERMAKETGGKSYFPGSVDDLAGIAREIGAELRMQYSIGYIPTNDREDGTFRNIRVTIKDGPNKQKRIAVTKAGRVATKEQ